MHDRGAAVPPEAAQTPLDKRLRASDEATAAEKRVLPGGGLLSADGAGTLIDGVYRYRAVVPAKAIDPLGHANNTAYVRWMQDAAVKHSEHLGMSWSWYVERGCAFVIRRQIIDYLRFLREGDEIEIATHVASMSQSASVRRTEIRLLGNGEAVLQAETTWIFVSLKTGRPMRIPQDVREAFGRKGAAASADQPGS